MPLASEMDSHLCFLLLFLLQYGISIVVSGDEPSPKHDLRRKNLWRQDSHVSVLLNLHRSLASKPLFKVHWPQQEPLLPRGDPQNSWRRRNSRYHSQDTSTARGLPLQPTKINNFSARSHPPWMKSSLVCGWDLAEVWMRSSRVCWWDLAELWMRSSRVVDEI